MKTVEFLQKPSLIFYPINMLSAPEFIKPYTHAFHTSSVLKLDFRKSKYCFFSKKNASIIFSVGWMVF